jgi:tight adherence protein B
VIAGLLFGSEVTLLVALGAVFLAVFLLVSFLMGVRARAKRRQALEHRLGRKRTAAGEDAPPVAATSWVPESFAQAGHKFAEAAGVGARLDQKLEQAGMPILAGEFIAITVLCVLVAGVIAAIFLQNIIFILLIAAFAGVIPNIWMKRSRRKRQQAFVDQLADTLSILASSLRAGYSFLQALDTVSKEIAEPSAGEFQRVVAEIRLGRPIDDAMTAMAERVGSEDLKWAVIAINVQRQVGGNLAEVLDIVSATVRERAYIHRQVQVLSAEGRLSVWILSVLPFGIMLYISIVNPDYIEPLFTTLFGKVLLVTGGLWMGLGIFVMSRMVKIDV